MPTIAFASSKGGVGKSTAALVLAGELAESYPVIVIDSDPNAALGNWYDGAGDVPNLTVVRCADLDAIQKEIADAQGKAPFVIVDLEGKATTLGTYAIGMSDLVIIPCKKSILDGRESVKTIREVERVSTLVNRDIPMSILFSQVRNAAQGRASKEIEAEFRGQNRVEIMEAEMMDRDPFLGLFSENLTTRQYLKKYHDNQAAQTAVQNAAAVARHIVHRIERIKLGSAA